MRHQFLKDGGDCTEEEMTNVINRATKEAKQFLHRTRDPPAAERMRKLQLKMSKEKKDAQRVKERLSKNAKHRVEIQEENAQRRKTNRDCKMRK